MSSTKLSIGIVGLPNVGKSTLFKALTKKPVDIANYPFCTIDPSVGVVQVPDERLQKLVEFSKPKKVVPAVVEFVDIAGLVKGASEGEGLGNQFLANIRETDAIAEVVRVFPARGGSASGGGEIIHFYGTVNPNRDIEIIETELILADLDTVTKREQGLSRDARGGDKDAIKKLEIVKKIRAGLTAGKTARECVSQEEMIEARDFHLLTFKPILYVFNISDVEGAGGTKNVGQNLPFFTKGNEGNGSKRQISDLNISSFKKFVALDIKTEEDIMDMSDEEKKELGVVSGIDKLIVGAYELLGLMTFFTTGEDETRAWTIKRNSTAPEAGMAIHTDFKDKFIRAEVINWQDLINAGSFAVAREKGLVRTEGKEYTVQDGDVIEFRI